MHLKNLALALLGAVMAGAVGGPTAAASDIKLYPPYVYPVAYEHLNRWCGPDALIINGADGQLLLRLDQTERDAARFNDPVDPLVVAGWAELAQGAGCLLEGKFQLTYWQETGALRIHRLQKDANAFWTADMFRRQENVELPGNFQNWTRSGDELFLAYRRPCSADTASDVCIGVERIDLHSLDRDKSIERRGSAPSQQASPMPDVNMLQETGHVAAMVVDEHGTSFCRIDPASLAPDCRIALTAPVERQYDYQYRRLTIDQNGDGFYELGEHIVHCRAWEPTASGQPMCQVVTPRIESEADAEVSLRAVLPGNLALVQAHQCLSIAEISSETGAMRNLQCLSDAIRNAAPKELRAALVEEETFAEERDGVTIPGWDVSVSPGGKWIAIQVPLKGCGDKVPTPETLEPSAGVATCGQVLVWRTDRFLRS